MSSQFPYAAATTVNSIAAAMKRHGGEWSVSSQPLQRASYGSKPIRYRQGSEL
jgi:hypothetical protein